MYFVMEMELILMEIFSYMEVISEFSVKEIEIMNLLIMMEISLFLMVMFLVLVLKEWNVFMKELKKEMKCMHIIKVI